MLIASTPIEQKILALIEGSLSVMGYALVRVRVSGDQRRTLQIMLERVDGAQITVEDCTEASYQISAVMDVHDPIAEAYRLEVSSPGIDRPLTRAEDFTRYAGFETKLEASPPVDGRKRFRGVLHGVEGDAAVMEVEGERYQIPLQSIANARLVMSDALIAAYTADASLNH